MEEGERKVGPEREERRKGDNKEKEDMEEEREGRGMMGRR